MRDGWVRTTLGAVAHTVRPSPSKPESSERYVGLEHFDPGSPRITRWGSTETVSSSNTAFRSGDVLFGKLRPYLRKVVVAHFEGRSTNEVLVYRPSTEAISRGYLGLVLQAREAIDFADASSVGSRMPRTSVKLMSALPVAIPPLDEQRRIVDLVGSLDDAIEAAEAAVSTSGAVLSELRRLTSGTENDRLGDLALMRSGPSWKSTDESKTPLPGYSPVLGITNTPAGGGIELSDRRYVSGVPDSAQRLDASSIVMIRTNGNRSRIGNVYRATEAVEGFAVSAFQIAIQPHDPADAEFLYWYLGSSEVQDAITENASGSTGLGNIAVGWLKQLSIPHFLGSGDRDEYVARCGAAGDVHRSDQTSVDRLLDLRSNLLTALLSGEHEIPESYDELMEEVAACR